MRRDDANPLVYFDVAISGGPTGTVDFGRVVFELYNDIAPKVSTCMSLHPCCPPLLAPTPAFAPTYLTGAKVARLQKTSASCALGKQALVNLPHCPSTSKALHSTES